MLANEIKYGFIPLSLRDANSFVLQYHRHHKPAHGCKWAIGLMANNKLVGISITGRPVNRFLDDKFTAEIIQLCTDSTPNACSKLYSQCVRIASLFGYKKIITYILESENGASLKASGFAHTHTTKSGNWDRPNRRRKDPNPTCPKKRYERKLL